MNRESQESLVAGGLLGAFFCLFMVGVIIGFANGGSYGERITRIEAVKNGHAEWVVKDNGSTEFKWKGTTDDNK